MTHVRSSRERRHSVVLADHDPLARSALRHHLQEHGLIVVADATTCREAFELTVHYRPDILLLDLVMPDGRGTDVLTRLRAAGVEDVRVVVLTSSDDDQEALEGLRLGAVGWLSKADGFDRLPQALAAAVNGEAAVTRRFTRVLVDELRSTPESQPGMRPVYSVLSPREWEVIDLVRAGLDDPAIAAELGVAVVTVRSHVRNIMRKLEVDAREGIAAAASARS